MIKNWAALESEVNRAVGQVANRFPNTPYQEILSHVVMELGNHVSNLVNDLRKPKDKELSEIARSLKKLALKLEAVK
jgi:hypothetical protein